VANEKIPDEGQDVYAAVGMFGVVVAEAVTEGPAPQRAEF